MNDVALAIEEARREVATAAGDILTDLCDILAPLVTDGGSSGDSVGLNPTPAAKGVNVSYKGLGNGRQYVVGGEAYTASHELKMVRTATTVTITPKHFIKVKPRGLTGQLIFEKPFIIEDSKSPFLIMGATLVKQGYQQ